MYIEIDVTYSINNEIFMQGFQNIKTRRRKYYKFYIFVCFFFYIFVVVNIWIFLFIRLYNLCFLRNILKKISRAITRGSRQAVPLVYLGNQQRETKFNVNGNLVLEFDYIIKNKNSTPSVPFFLSSIPFWDVPKYYPVSKNKNH